jgi:DNA gyrase/topoisomerase IV subunit A
VPAVKLDTLSMAVVLESQGVASKIKCENIPVSERKKSGVFVGSLFGELGSNNKFWLIDTCQNLSIVTSKGRFKAFSSSIFDGSKQGTKELWKYEDIYEYFVIEDEAKYICVSSDGRLAAFQGKSISDTYNSKAITLFKMSTHANMVSFLKVDSQSEIISVYSNGYISRRKISDYTLSMPSAVHRGHVAFKGADENRYGPIKQCVLVPENSKYCILKNEDSEEKMEISHIPNKVKPIEMSMRELIVSGFE